VVFARTPLNHVSRTCYRELPDGQRVEVEEILGKQGKQAGGVRAI